MGERKVEYKTRSGYYSKAYVDDETGEGVDKHSDIPVTVAWSDELSEWVQTDDREWLWTDGHGWVAVEPELAEVIRKLRDGDSSPELGQTFVDLLERDERLATPKAKIVKGQRKQPKRLSRKERRG